MPSTTLCMIIPLEVTHRAWCITIFFLSCNTSHQLKKCVKSCLWQLGMSTPALRSYWQRRVRGSVIQIVQLVAKMSVPEEQINEDYLVELLALRSAGKRTAGVFNLVSTICLYWWLIVKYPTLIMYTYSGIIAHNQMQFVWLNYKSLKRYYKRKFIVCNQDKFQAQNREMHRKHNKMREFKIITRYL